MHKPEHILQIRGYLYNLASKEKSPPIRVRVWSPERTRSSENPSPEIRGWEKAVDHLVLNCKLRVWFSAKTVPCFFPLSVLLSMVCIGLCRFRKNAVSLEKSRKASKIKGSRMFSESLENGCGRGTWTPDLRVMSPTSYQLLYPASSYWFVKWYRRPDSNRYENRFS